MGVLFFMTKMYGILFFSVLVIIGLVGCGTNQKPLEEAKLTEAEAEQTKEENTFTRWTSEEVFDAFLQADVELGSTYEMTPEDFGMTPMVSKQAHRILIPSLGEEPGGRLFIFDNQQDLDLTKSYYDDLGTSSALLFSWTIVRDNVLLQINGNMPEEQMLIYEQALYEMEK